MQDNFQDYSIEYLYQKVIGALGVEKTKILFQTLLGDNSSSLPAEDLLTLQCIYIKAKARTFFEISEEEIDEGNSKAAKQAKMSCFYLLKRHSQASNKDIEIQLFGEQDKVPGRSVRYYAEICERKLAKHPGDERFKRKFNALETDYLSFLVLFVMK